MQFLIGALRLGTIANFISPAALRGFTGGAAALIALYALPDLLGLRPPSAHRLGDLAQHLWANIDRPRRRRSASASSPSPHRCS
jgi:SulP family sulfate permease